MRLSCFLLFVSILSSFCSFGQSLNIKGKVLDNELLALPGVNIYDQDTLLLTTSDWNGNFELSLTEPNRLIFGYIGMEWENLLISSSCANLEIIMLYATLYHYNSHRKIDRLRKEEFDKRMLLHEQAFEQGIFESATPCFKYQFIPDKPELDEIRKWMNKKKIEIREEFKQLSIGDTIYVPYSGSGTNSIHTSYSDYTNYDCLIEGIVLEKDKKRRGFNILYMVINMDNCNYQPFMNDDKAVKVGDSIKHNMRYARLITASNNGYNSSLQKEPQ